MRDRLTFVVFTFNEEKRIPWIIANFGDIANILVVDNESTDRTVELARSGGCEVLINKNQGWVEDEVTASRVKQAVRTEWIYWGFADEMLSPPVLRYAFTEIESGSVDIIRLKRKNYFYGAFCQNVLAPYQTRFFRKDAIDFTGNTIHNFGRATVPEARIHQSPSNIFIGHFITDDMTTYLRKINGYTDTEKRQHDGIGSLEFLRMFFVTPIRIFLAQFIGKGGWRAGIPGFILVFTQMLYAWSKAIKLYEKGKGFSESDMEDKYASTKRLYVGKAQD